VVSVLDDQGLATTALVSDFTLLFDSTEVPLTFPSNDEGLLFARLFLGRLYVSTSIKVLLSAPNLVLYERTFQVHGFPSVYSSLGCSIPSVVRRNQMIECSIIVRDASGGLTTGVAADFNVLSSANLSIPLRTDSFGSEFAFTVSPPSHSLNFTIQATVGDEVIEAGLIFFVVYGYPDGTSLLVCDSSRARVGGSPIDCNVTAREAGADTIAVSQDFTFYVNGDALSNFLSVGSERHVFSTMIDPPAVIADDFEVSVFVGGALLRSVFRIFSRFAGVPVDTSLLSCAPAVTRANTTLSCSIVFFNSRRIPTSVFPDEISIRSEFAVASRRAIDQSVSNLVTSDGGKSYKFDALSPSDVGTLSLHVDYVDQPVRSLDLSIFDLPSIQSTLSCNSSLTGPYSVQSLDRVQCTINTRRLTGRTRCLASDFVVHINNVRMDSSSLTTQDSGFTFELALMAPNSSKSTFDISVSTWKESASISGSPYVFDIICLMTSLLL
jgi:hypothetical protein